MDNRGASAAPTSAQQTATASPTTSSPWPSSDNTGSRSAEPSTNPRPPINGRPSNQVVNQPSSSETTSNFGNNEATPTDGNLQVREGSVYWKFDPSKQGQDKYRPTVLLIHAGVADSTMWDGTVALLTGKGYNCLRLDLFGHGRSYPSDAYLRARPRPPWDPIEHLEQLRQSLLSADAKVIVVGLSVGSSYALAYTLAHPQHVVGLALIAGGLRGFDYNNQPEEDKLLEEAEKLVSYGDVHGAANLQVRIWGDGPLQEPGRLDENIADRMLKWNIDLAARECAKKGGFALETVEPDPPAAQQLNQINVPTAVAYGVFDETYTNAAMKHVAANVRGAYLKEFQTAHMVNLEAEDEFNRWLSDWLEVYF